MVAETNVILDKKVTHVRVQLAREELFSLAYVRYSRTRYLVYTVRLYGTHTFSFVSAFASTTVQPFRSLFAGPSHARAEEVRHEQG